MILLIDNYDSFVYNLARYFRELGCETRVERNDALSVDKIVGLDPAAIVISPGPGRPADAGISVEAVRAFGSSVPVLGICLGHQAIGEAFGARIIRADEPVHGRTSEILHEGTGLFSEMTNPFSATRYHSLIVDPDTLPDEFTVTAQTIGGVIMGMSHTRLPIHGFQFHPESVLTDDGHRLLANFLSLAGLSSAEQPTGDLELPCQAAEVELPQPLHW